MPRWVKKWPVNSDSGKDYTVSLADDGKTWGCSCPQWIFKRRTCRHILQIQLELTHEELKMVKAMKADTERQEILPISKKKDSRYSDDGRMKRRLDLD